MAKILTPESDLRLKMNNQVTTGNNNGNHLHKRGGEEIADPETRTPFRDIGSHVCGSDKRITEKLDSMAEAILMEDWIRFDGLFFDLKGFKPSRKCLNAFGREQVKETVIRNPPIIELETLRRKLGEIGVTDEAMDEGYEDAQRILESRKN